MKKGTIYEGIIERVDFPNKGIVHIPEENQYVIVKNGIPGQKVRFMINKFKKGSAEGRLLFRNAEDACIRLCPMKSRSE